MFRKQPIFIDAKDPEYYAELLRNLNTSRLVNQSLTSDIPGIQGINSSLSLRRRDRELILLDVLADISLCQRGNVSATAASLRGDSGSLETRLYIVLNRELDDEAVRCCRRHLETLFSRLRQVPYESPAMDGTRKVTVNSLLETELIEICGAIHNYSFDIFAHRVTKHKDKLSEIQGYIEQDRTHFEPQDRAKLVEFLQHVDGIIKIVTNLQAKKQLPAIIIRMLLYVYSYWTKHNLLPKDMFADNKPTFLDHVDTWLADEHDIGFRLRRRALKIMSFVISAIRLFALTQSKHLRNLILGKFSVQFLTSPTAAPYSCNLSSEAIQGALDAALAGTDYLSAGWNEERESFIDRLKEPEVVRYKPTVHAEIAMVMAMVKEEIPHFIPYIGISKLSCIMCSQYIHTFNKVMGQNIAISGSHGKAYPGWPWPIPPARDEELREDFLKRIREQLRSDFEDHAETHRRRSDSSVGSGTPRLDLHPTEDVILELMNAALCV